MSANQPNAPLPASGKPMPLYLQFIIGGYVVVVALVILYLLVKLWPIAGTPLEPADFFWGQYLLPSETRYLLIAALAGALGAYIHLATSFADYAGNEQLTVSWAWWYLLRPFIGMALAVVVYLALRGGVVGAGGTQSVSPYGVAALCALSGLFSKQATDKLREIFENIFRTEQPVERKDALAPQTGAARGGKS